jgi:hypothetical protein
VGTERHLNRFGILIILIFRLTTILERQGRRGLNDNPPKGAPMFECLVTKKIKRKVKEKEKSRKDERN